MTEQESYEAGLAKLNIAYKAAVWVDDDRDWCAPDLRTDPAFAWRVLEALWSDDPNGTASLLAEVAMGSAAETLYMAVCVLGRGEE